MKMKKGITPVISIIILLLITIALAGAAWSYLSGVLTAQISKSFSIPTGGAYCSTGGIIKMTIVNTGTTTITDSDFIVSAIDSNSVTPQTVSIAPGDSAMIIDDDNSGAGWASGSHTIDIGTSGAVFHPPVVCP